MIFGIKKIDYFDPNNVFLAIATNIPQRLKTGFVVQGHIYTYIIQKKMVTVSKNICTQN